MPKRTCVITPGGARVCGRVQNTPTVVQACVAAVINAPGAKKRGVTTSGAFAICTASAQKRGIVKPGTRELTRKGERADAGISRNRRATTERRYEQAVKASGSAADPRAPAVERFVPLTRADGVVLLFRGDPKVIQGHTLDHAREYGIDANEYTRFHRSLDSALARLEGRYVYVIPVAPNGRTVPSDFSFVRNGKLMAVPGHRASGKAGFWSRLFGEKPAAPPATAVVHVGDYVADSYGTINQITKLRSDGIAETRGLDEYGSTWRYPFSEIHATPKPYSPGTRVVFRGKPYTVREHTNEHVIYVTDSTGRKSEIRRPDLVSRA